MQETHAVPHHRAKIELCILAILLWQGKLQVDHLSRTEVAGDDCAHSSLRKLKAAAMDADFAILSEDPDHQGELGAIPGKAPGGA